MNDKEFIKFIQDNQGIIYKICRIYSDRKEDFEDLQQEIMLQFWKSLSSFKNQSKLSTWLYRVALNTALNFKRKKGIEIIKNDLTDYNLTHRNIKNRYEEEIQWLYKAIHQLNNLDKAIIRLYLEEKSYLEISEITGFPKEQIGVKIARIKSKLQKLLQPIFKN